MTQNGGSGRNALTINHTNSTIQPDADQMKAGNFFGVNVHCVFIALSAKAPFPHHAVTDALTFHPDGHERWHSN